MQRSLGGLRHSTAHSTSHSLSPIRRHMSCAQATPSSSRSRVSACMDASRLRQPGQQAVRQSPAISIARCLPQQCIQQRPAMPTGAKHTGAIHRGFLPAWPIRHPVCAVNQPPAAGSSLSWLDSRRARPSRIRCHRATCDSGAATSCLARTPAGVAADGVTRRRPNLRRSVVAAAAIDSVAASSGQARTPAGASAEGVAVRRLFLRQPVTAAATLTKDISTLEPPVPSLDPPKPSDSLSLQDYGRSDDTCVVAEVRTDNDEHPQLSTISIEVPDFPGQFR